MIWWVNKKKKQSLDISKFGCRLHFYLAVNGFRNSRTKHHGKFQIAEVNFRSHSVMVEHLPINLYLRTDFLMPTQHLVKKGILMHNTIDSPQLEIKYTRWTVTQWLLFNLSIELNFQIRLFITLDIRVWHQHNILVR